MWNEGREEKFALIEWHVCVVLNLEIAYDSRGIVGKVEVAVHYKKYCIMRMNSMECEVQSRVNGTR